MLLKGSAECVYLCECVLSRVCFRRVLHYFIEQDGAPSPLIPLLFIGLDGPSSNCIKAPLPRYVTLHRADYMSIPTHGKHQARRSSAESRTGRHLRYGQLCSWVDGCVRWAGGEKGESGWQRFLARGICCATFQNGDLADLNSDHAPHSANRQR